LRRRAPWWIAVDDETHKPPPHPTIGCFALKLASEIDLNLLAVFETIYSKGGVTHAARHLNLSQPAVSHSLARLRDAFGDKLFVRSGNALVPTTLAQAMIGPVREALRHVETAFAAAMTFDPQTSTRAFSIGLRQSGEMRSFPGLVADALREAPGLALASLNFRRRDLAASLADGHLDLAIDVRNASQEGLCSELLKEDNLVVVARADHPRVRGRIDLDTFLALDHIVASPRPRGLDGADAALAEFGKSRRVSVRCQHVWSAWQIVATSDLICTLPSSYAETMNLVSGNQIVPFPLAITPNALFMYWHEAADRDPGNQWLRSIVRQHFAAS
jgi:DNA-binding transcriptional LysR family regulator